MKIGHSGLHELSWTSYGVSWNKSTNSYTRSGAVSNYAAGDAVPDALLPIQREMKRCVLNDDGTVNYYLSASNSAYKANGDASDLSGTDGQIMVEIPKFYYSSSYTSDDRSYYVSLANLTGYTLHPAFIKDETEVEYRYYGAFEGYVDNNDTGIGKLYSISGSYPATERDMTGETPSGPKLTNAQRNHFRLFASNRNTGNAKWRQEDYYLRSAIQLLYLIEYADFDSQDKIGNGRTTTSDSGSGGWSAYNVGGYIGITGNSVNDGNFTNADNSTGYQNNSYMSYRGIENLYGNVWKFIDGIAWDGTWTGVAAPQPVYVSNNINDFEDSQSGSMTYLCDAPLIGPSGSYIGDIVNAVGFIPSASGASDLISDYYWQYSESARACWRDVLTRGDAHSGGTAGLFALTVSGHWSSDNPNIGARLCF